ncbi:MAG: MFS transporter [Aestuariivirga sp.]|nr:MFS transporter [Aestuariivirga sp.]
MQKIPRGVWVLGLVSLFMDVSSEMIHALLPVFLIGTLGVSATFLGLIEGLAEGTAQIMKMASGLLSDRFGNRKVLALLGYGLAALVKPLFPLADMAFTVFVARIVDRIGKGIRGAPRDALVADITPPDLRGAAFGLRQSMDTVGAFIGPLAAVGLMIAYTDNVRTVLWFACAPALVAVLILALGIREPEHVAKGQNKPGMNLATAKLLGSNFWIVVLVGAIFMLARFSEAFLIIKASEVGLAARYVPLILVVMSLVYALTSYPVGVLSDRIGRRGLLLLGLAALLAADLVLGFATSLAPVFIGVALWGLHMGLTQGLLSALVADTAPAELRGTAFGIFSLVSGVVLLIASTLAGVLWDVAGSQATFMAGAAFTASALVLLPFVQVRAHPSK